MFWRGEGDIEIRKQSEEAAQLEEGEMKDEKEATCEDAQEIEGRI